MTGATTGEDGITPSRWMMSLLFLSAPATAHGGAQTWRLHLSVEYCGC